MNLKRRLEKMEAKCPTNHGVKFVLRAPGSTEPRFYRLEQDGTETPITKEQAAPLLRAPGPLNVTLPPDMEVARDGHSPEA